MYTFFYHLLDRPFTALPDPAFFWLGPKYAEALSMLCMGILESRGFVLLTGDAGCGKTTLLNALTGSLDRTVLWAVVSDPGLERLDFYNAIAKGFGIDREFTSKVQFILQFSALLHKAHDEGKKTVLLIDDCHRLSQDMLEELRLLANIAKADAGLINIFLAGRRDFLDALMQPNNRAFRQRLTLQAELFPLSPDEVRDYIRHRLQVAGTQQELFTAGAIAVIHRAAGGIPRLINMICDQALHAGAAAGSRQIGHELVEGCLGRQKLPPIDGSEGGDGAEQTSHRRFPRPLAPLARIYAGAVAAGRAILAGSPDWRWGKYAVGIALISGAGLAFLLPLGNDRKAVPEADQPVLRQPAGREKSRNGDSPAVGEAGKLEPIGKAINLHLMAEPKKIPARKGGEGEENRQGPGPEEKKAEGPAPSQEQDKAAAAPAAEQPTPEQKSDAEPAPVRPAPEPALPEETVAKKADEMPVVPRPELAKAPASAPVPPRKVVLPLRANSLELTAEATNDYRVFIDSLKSHPKAILLVKGFVSAQNNSPENIKLSEERAVAVQKILVKSGIAPSRIKVKGMGNQEPIAPNDTSEGRTKNRRVEIEVMGEGQDIFNNKRR